MVYRHTQPGFAIVFLCLVAIALDVGIIWHTGLWMPTAAALVVLAAIAIVFSSLTV